MVFIKCRCLGPIPCVGQVYNVWPRNLHFSESQVTLKEGSQHTHAQKL